MKPIRPQARLLLAVLLLFSGIAGAAEAPLRVGVHAGDYPFAFTEEGRYEGFEVDLLRAICERLGLEPEFVDIRNPQLSDVRNLPGLDTIASRTLRSPESRQSFAHTQPYLYAGAALVVRRGDSRIRAVEDLRGRTVAVAKGSRYHRLLQDLSFSNDLFIRTDDSRIAHEIAIGHSDAFVTGRFAAIDLVRNYPLPLQLVDTHLAAEAKALPFHRSERGLALRNRVDRVLTELKLDGSLKKLSMKWFGMDVTRP